MWGCQHFQAQDNCALFPRCIGKIINIPGVCFQAALWNKSQTVVVSLGSPVPQNCVFSLHESPLTLQNAAQWPLLLWLDVLQMLGQGCSAPMGVSEPPALLSAPLQLIPWAW